MAITEQQIQDSLKELIDPNTGKDYVTGKEAKNIRIDENKLGLMKRTNEILPNGVIDACLSTDGSVDHAEQRRGNLYDRYATENSGGDEACHIGDDAAAQPNQDRIAADSAAKQLIVDGKKIIKSLVALSSRNHHRVQFKPEFSHRRGDFRQM